MGFEHDVYVAASLIHLHSRFGAVDVAHKGKSCTLVTRDGFRTAAINRLAVVAFLITFNLPIGITIAILWMLDGDSRGYSCSNLRSREEFVDDGSSDISNDPWSFLFY
ncbi:hypothetical protein E2542_SST28871 [Spatholobus suberectus]|nr:hypothetical protein E2542_SST28871 [Spatholobus suberectus]